MRSGSISCRKREEAGTGLREPGARPSRGPAQSLARKPVYPRRCPRAHGVGPRPAASTQSLGDGSRTHTLLVPGDRRVSPSGWPPSEGPQGLVWTWGPANPAPFLAGPRPTRVSSTWASWLRGQGPPSWGGGWGDSVLRTELLRDAAQPLPRQHLPAAPRPSNGDQAGVGGTRATADRRGLPHLTPHLGQRDSQDAEPQGGAGGGGQWRRGVLSVRARGARHAGAACSA